MSKITFWLVSIHLITFTNIYIDAWSWCKLKQKSNIRLNKINKNRIKIKNNLNFPLFMVSTCEFTYSSMGDYQLDRTAHIGRNVCQ